MERPGTDPDGSPTPVSTGAGGRRVGPAAAWAFVGVLHVVLLTCLRIYPFIDLPNHLAKATIFRYYGDAANDFARFYSVPTLFKPNVFHLAFCGLPLFPTVEMANTVFLCLYAVLLPLAIARILNALGGDPWFTLLAFVPLYNFSVGWGLVDFAFAIPLVLLFYLLLLRHLATPGVWRGIAVAAALTGLFFVHAQATLFALLLFACTVAAHSWRSPAILIRRCLLAVPTLLVFFLWWLADWSRSEPSGESLGTFGALFRYYHSDYLSGFFRRATPLFLADNSFLGREASWLLAGAVLFLILVWQPARGVWQLTRSRGECRIGTRLLDPIVLLGCSLLCYFVLPEDIPGHQFVSQRFAVFVLLALVVLGGVMAPRGPSRARPTVFCAAAVLHLALWTGYFAGFQRENSAFGPDVLPDPRSGPMGALIYDARYRDQPIYIHFPNYQIVWNRGIATTRLVDYRFGVVRRLVPESVLPVYHDWVGGGDAYRGQYASLSSILVRGEIPANDAVYLRHLSVTRAAGKWSLYERETPRSR